MVLGIGLVSAFIVARKNTKHTRLEKLQADLHKRPRKMLKFYQLPTKKLFIIFLLTLFVLLLGCFEEQFIFDIMTSNLHFQAMEAAGQQLQNVSNVIFWVKVLNTLMMIAVISDLRLKVVQAKKDSSSILISEYSCVFWKPKLSSIRWKNAQKLSWRIESIGEQKFTQNTLRYGVKLLDLQQKCEWLLLQRGDIFHARKALIELSSIFNFKPNLRIH